jgi:putative intracellular protease/amidase
MSTPHRTLAMPRRPRWRRWCLLALVGLWLAPAGADDAARADAAPARLRRRVAIVANNSGAETTDLLAPFAVLRDAGVADVAIVAVTAGPVELMPGLTVLPDATLDAYDPPDVAIVPAMHDPTAPGLLAALQRFAHAGTLLVSICDGAWVLARAGLLDGRSATSHWYSIPGLRRAFPRTTWRQDVRWVADGNVITSAGVSASLPISQRLAELLAGSGPAIGDQTSGPPHDGARFGIGAGDVIAGAENYLLPWRHETVAVPLDDGVDELALALTVDTLHRTYAVRTVTVGSAATVRGRRGLLLVPDVVDGKPPDADRTVVIGPPDLDRLLADVEAHYGAPTRRLVALQIEYPPGRW